MPRLLFRALVVIAAVAFVLTACSKRGDDAGETPTADSTTPAATSTGTPVRNPVLTGLPLATDTETPLSDLELPDFAERLERAVTAAIRDLAESDSVTIAGDDGPQQEFTATIGGRDGSLSASGFIFQIPWPSRYEAVFALNGFASDAGNDATGELLVNFVYDDRANPPAAYALFRGVINELGPFDGTYTVHGEVYGGALTALETGTGRPDIAKRAPDSAPREFISYVSTVAGNGEQDDTDGPASEALFNAPVAISMAEKDGDTYVFISDVGNKRIRLLIIKE